MALVWLARAKRYIARGETAKARKALEEVMLLAPGSGAAKEAEKLIGELAE